MVLITPQLVEDLTSPDGGYLTLTAPGMSPLYISFEATLTSPPLQVTINHETLSAYSVGTEASDWITTFLGQPALLVFKDPADVRAVVRNAPSAATVGFQPETAFADCHPVLLTTTSSLDSLCTHLPQPISIEHFRPNIHLSAASPYEEETWKQIRVGKTLLYVASRSTRCIMPTVDMETGVFSEDRQPLKVLQKLRRVDNGKTSKYYGCFGMNVVPGVRGGARLKVGDPVKVLEWGEHMRTD